MFSAQPHIDLQQLVQWDLDFDLGLKRNTIRQYTHENRIEDGKS